MKKKKKNLFYSLLSHFIKVLHAGLGPVDFGCFQTCGWNSGVRETDKDGVVGPTYAIQTDEVAVVVFGEEALKRTQNPNDFFSVRSGVVTRLTNQVFSSTVGVAKIALYIVFFYD